MNHDARPLLAVTMGDPAGCGPEVIAQVAASGLVRKIARLVCVGDAGTMERALGIVGGSCNVRAITHIADTDDKAGRLDVLDLINVNLSQLKIGQVQAAAGQAAYEYLTTAIDLALAGKVSGVVTAPLNKAALHLAGHRYDGHTEILKLRTNSDQVTMMLAAGAFRVTHVSTHCSLRQAIDRCKTARILDVIRLTDRGLRQIGIEAPRLAVAGLNPHSGEGGLFGDEEIEQIQPAIDAARSEGLAVYGWPVPPDTVFVRMQEGHEFDAVVAQYHDQGHIACKLVDFMGGVNITLGLPIIRTSVDHGTAFDLAGTGRANPRSLINAIRYATQMAANWGKT
jgi:4-hydroxythreonine-4-phosphate dehydrogenase